jgi:hypothetical protein
VRRIFDRACSARRGIPHEKIVRHFHDPDRAVRNGELRREADIMVDPHSRNMPARLPATGTTGEVIAIRYQTSGNTFADSFRVTGITIKGDRCSIESKHNNADGRELVDIIFARPCSKLK